MAGSLIDSTISGRKLQNLGESAEGGGSESTVMCSVCLKKQLDKPGERCSIKYVHNHVEQKVPNAVTSGEPDARVVYS